MKAKVWFTPYVSPFSFGQGGPNVSPISVRTTEYDMNRTGALALGQNPQKL
jgi:hypothetical protein